MSMSLYAAKRILAEVCEPGSRNDVVRWARRLGEIALATNGRCTIALTGLGDALGLTPLPEGPIATVLRDSLGTRGQSLLGTVGLHALAEWAGPYETIIDIDGERTACGPRPGVIRGRHFDRQLLARCIHLLALVCSGSVEVHASSLTSTTGQVLTGLLFVGTEWRCHVVCWDEATRPTGDDLAAAVELVLEPGEEQS